MIYFTYYYMVPGQAQCLYFKHNTVQKLDLPPSGGGVSPTETVAPNYLLASVNCLPLYT